MTTQKIFQLAQLGIALAAGLWGSLPVTFQILIVVMLLDIVTGFIRSALDKTVSSGMAWKGVLKKALSIMVVLLGASLQHMSGITLPIAESLAAFYIYVEAVSLLENAAAVGVPIPQFLRDILAQLNPEKMGRRVSDPPQLK